MENVKFEHKRFTSIEGFKHFAQNARKFHDQNTLTIRGTIKLHGTHADIVYKKIGNDEKIYYQSRNRIITKEDDNAGFAAFMDNIPISVKTQLIENIKKRYLNLNPMMNYDKIDDIFIAGEFCGGNIQKNVALTKLQKLFVIFHLKINNIHQDITEYNDIHLEEYDIYNIVRGGVYKLEVSLDNIYSITPKLKEITDNVEKECPFAKSFKVSGIGEGVVWVSETHLKMNMMTDYCFKVKGEEHSVTRVSTLKPPSAATLKALSDVREFVEKAVTENRLEQGISYMEEMKIPIDKKHLGDFIKWVVSDTLKEENDTCTALRMESKKITKVITEKAKKWYLKKYDFSNSVFKKVI